MPRHKWDGKITKKVRFVTCLKCGIIKESAPVLSGYLYYPPTSGIEVLFKAGECPETLIKQGKE